MSRLNQLERNDATGELQAARDAAFDDGEIVEIIAQVGVNAWTSLLGKAGQIDIDFPKVELFERRLTSNPRARPASAGRAPESPEGETDARRIREDDVHEECARGPRA